MKKSQDSPQGLLYIPAFLSAEDQLSLLRELETLDYKHDSFRGQKLKRSYAQFGFEYVSTGHGLKQAPSIPEFLSRLIEKVVKHHLPEETFNQVIVTRYPAGAGIGWHTDAPVFGECIFAVSLGAHARLQLRPIGTKDKTFEIVVAPGSMYILAGQARWHYQHQIVPVKSDRYSITFRHVR